MSRKMRAAPIMPLTVELAPYRQAHEPGFPGNGVVGIAPVPITPEDFEREMAERITLARVSLVDSKGGKASAFVSVQRIRGGLMIRIEQDQTDYNATGAASSRIARREFKLRFFE